MRNILGNFKNISVYPNEANELWHPKLYPWRHSKVKTPPYWISPNEFVNHSLKFWSNNHRALIKSKLGSFQWLHQKEYLLVDSAMLTFIIPEIISLFPDSKFIHVLRDGRVSSYLVTKKEYGRMHNFSECYKRKGYYYGSLDDLYQVFANHWKQTILEINKLKSIGLLKQGENFIEVSYESYCENITQSFNDVGKIINLPLVENKILPRLFNQNQKINRYDISDETKTNIDNMLRDVLLEKNYMV